MDTTTKSVTLPDHMIANARAAAEEVERGRSDPTTIATLVALAIEVVKQLK